MKIQRIHALLLVAIASITLFTSCADDETEWFPVKGAGEMQVQERSVPSFIKIRSGISARIVILESSEPRLKISAQKNLIPLLQTEVSDGTLYLSFGKHAVISDSLITVTISQSQLTSLTMAGSGSASSSLPVSSIYVSGSASLRCTGQTDQVYVKLSGSGTVDLQEMFVRKAEVKISGNGNVSLNVADDLNVSIPGTGIVYYRGQPQIKESITGVGQVISTN